MPICYALSDNGSEFIKDFEAELQRRISLIGSPARSRRKMNAHCGRFNRTIQEQFGDYHENQLFHDLPGFNRKLADWLVDCNTVLPHHSLGLQSPATSLSIINPRAKGAGLWIQLISATSPKKERRDAAASWFSHQST